MFKEILVRLFISKVKDGLDLQEGTPMENGKAWYKSKTIWSDVATVLVTLYVTVQAVLVSHYGVHLPEIPAWLLTVLGTTLGVTGIAGRVTATETITK